MSEIGNKFLLAGDKLLPKMHFTHRRTTSDKILRDEAFNITRTPKYEGYQHGHTSMVYKIFNKKSALLAWSDTLAT